MSGHGKMINQFCFWSHFSLGILLNGFHIYLNYPISSNVIQIRPANFWSRFRSINLVFCLSISGHVQSNSCQYDGRLWKRSHNAIQFSLGHRSISNKYLYYLNTKWWSHDLYSVYFILCINLYTSFHFIRTMWWLCFWCFHLPYILLTSNLTFLFIFAE